ncbi:MAG: aminoglycoside phosphotransferase, partial [Gammaproteobacteria bacterium]|nr:aminoglycoside phosphotransferase [Gammaproteobacteria bacterium]
MTAQFGVDFQQQQQLIKSLSRADSYNHITEPISVIETHISWVILSGPYAYKIKKSLNLGFLDYSTLPLRHQCCEQELRINRRTAADIYLDCVPISGPVEHPHIGGTKDVIEYAVKMHQFPQQALLSHLAEKGRLSTRIIDQLAKTLAEFHHAIDRLQHNSALGSASAIWHPIAENFEQISERMDDETTHAALIPLRHWAEQQF